MRSATLVIHPLAILLAQVGSGMIRTRVKMKNERESLTTDAPKKKLELKRETVRDLSTANPASQGSSLWTCHPTGCSEFTGDGGGDR